MTREYGVNRVTLRAFGKVEDKETTAKLLLTARLYRLGILMSLDCLENRLYEGVYV